MLTSSLYATTVGNDQDRVANKNAADLSKEKKYRIKDDRWFCQTCDIFCNSDSQFQVHLMSTKHKMPKNEAAITDEVKVSYTSKRHLTSLVECM